MGPSLPQLSSESRSRIELAAGQKGDNVAIPIPLVDRGRGDPRNILAVILDRSENDNYTLATKHGILKGAYSRSEFELCPEKLPLMSDVNCTTFVSLREAVVFGSRCGGQGYIKCNCSGSKKCQTNRDTLDHQVCVELLSRHTRPSGLFTTSIQTHSTIRSVYSFYPQHTEPYNFYPDTLDHYVCVQLLSRHTRPYNFYPDTLDHQAMSELKFFSRLFLVVVVVERAGEVFQTFHPTSFVCRCNSQ
ncbi:KRAB-A domain-containing protein 2 [Elysia marginata]|uniref:KRAB-A domain-containing protein 2 n=1 Tax=Elysia marginata TaxID=1093978 RepID=A0AAV4JDM2_9GAST|nr:KRAB-A domain-containing protein 2 [Elysia marginata]